jgi:hypothetical protein
MQIKLSNFAKYIGNHGISIANSQPENRNNPVYEPLQPGWDLVNGWKAGIISDAVYTRLYKQQLAKLDANQVYTDLCALVNGNVPVLLCWCKKGTFCHRYLVTEWLKENLVIEE